MSAPVAPRSAREVGVHSDQRADPYYWLRERENPKVLDYLRAENDFARATLAHTESLQNKLYHELLARIQETDVSVPEKDGSYYYYSRTEKGKQYSIHCRKKSLGADEEILLDENELARGHDYFGIGAFEVSPDEALLAYSIDTDGSEAHTIYVKDLKAGKLLNEEIPNTYYGLEWGNDNRTLFYNILDDAKRPHKLFRHQLGTAAASDELIYREENSAFFLRIHKTKSKKYLILSLGSNSTTEVHYLRADRPDGDFKVIQPRQHEVEYYIAHQGDHFYILTNDDAENFKLMRAPVKQPGKANWDEVIPHRKSVKIDDIDVFKRHLVVYERESGLKQIRIEDLATRDVHYVEFDEPVYTFWPADNPEFDTDQLRFNYTSLITTRSVFDYDMSTRTRSLKKHYEVLGGYERENYRSERVFATAADGTKVPISLVYRRDLQKNGANPLILYGYGSYGASIEPYFTSNRLSLLDRGFVYAIAHVRGGGELGRQWYDQGKLLNKHNTFTDFIACGEYLVDKKYTSRGRIACYGGSAGGMLMGVVVNRRPDLFCAVVAHVPFVDVLTTMLDKDIPLTVIEYEEWGNPHDKKYYEYMRSYSPYDNLEAQDYPNMLVTAGMNDPRVQYWEPAKWVAKLRTVKTDDNLLLLKTKMGEGHSGASGRYDYLRDVAFEFAFIFDCFGIDE